MMGAKAIFGLLALFLVAAHFADAQAEGKRKCKRRENYYGSGRQGEEKCGMRQTPWKTVIEEEDYRIECRCRGGLLRLRECSKCVYENTTTTTVAPTESTTVEAVTTASPVTTPATEVPSTPEIPSSTEAPATDAPATEAPATEAPATDIPVSTDIATEVPTEDPSVDTTIAF